MNLDTTQLHHQQYSLLQVHAQEGDQLGKTTNVHIFKSYEEIDCTNFISVYDVSNGYMAC